MRYFALIPAAGSGARMGAECAKQYLPLSGQPMIYHALNTLCCHPDIAQVYVVLAADDAQWDCHDWSALADRLTALRCGGETRAESVKNGLAAMSSKVMPDDWILVHDAARPCLQAANIDALLDGVSEADCGGILAVPVADTLKLAEGDSITKTISRADLWQAQTPQMFRHGLLTQALAHHAGVTDEASAVEALGLHPKLIMSDTSNLKVTYPQDLQLAEWILQNRTRA